VGSEETSEVTKVGKEVCQERLVCQVSGSRAVNRKGCQDSEMSRANQIERKWHHQKRKSRERNVRERKTSRQTAGNRKGCHGGFKPTWEFKASSQYDAFRGTK
jgi:hypothetical protein